MSAARLIVDAQAALGECPLWCERSATLTWTDIEGCTLTRWVETDGSLRTWALPERVGSFALCESPSLLLLGLASGIALFDLATEALGNVVRVEADNPITRINDGRCDRQGRFVFGMFAPGRNPQPRGHFYRVDAKLNVERLPLPPAVVANSIAFSPDGSPMYFTDTPTRQIMCCDYFDDGRVGVPRRFVRVPDSEGFPDGTTVDAEGGLWNAQWRGNCVVRYDADGRMTDRIELPASQVTCPAFGGAAFDQLFATSARVTLDDDALRRELHAGGVFAIATNHRGLPEQRFITAARA